VKDGVRKKTFPLIKFADQLDLRKQAEDIGLNDLKIKAEKLSSFIPCLIKKMRTETSVLRCSVIRSIKAKFEGT
jgi:hypothetical protein